MEELNAKRLAREAEREVLAEEVGRTSTVKIIRKGGASGQAGRYIRSVLKISHRDIGYGGGGCTQFVHDRSRMTIDIRIHTMQGRSTSGFHQPGRHCLHQARSDVRCSASRMKGKLHLTKNRS